MTPDCPTCVRSFDNWQAVSTHHASQHPHRWADRLWARVDKGGEDECWEWQGGTSSGGYGQMKVCRKYRGAHRLAYIDTYGFPDDYVLHHCDNPLCCNPSHLYDGTHQDNMDDMVVRGRSLTGEKNPQCELTAEEVAEIRERYRDEDVSHSELADEFGAARRHVGRVVNGEMREDAPGPIKGEDYEQAGMNVVLTESEVAEIRRRYRDEDVSQRELADEFGVAQRHVGRVVNGERREDAPGPINGEDYEQSWVVLTESDVAEIRERYRDEAVSQAELADEFGVSRTHVSDVVDGEKWPHAPGPIKGEDY